MYDSVCDKTETRVEKQQSMSWNLFADLGNVSGTIKYMNV